MHSDDDLLPLSGLQHLVFCERQCALIHVEQVWEENRLTAEGRLMHDHVHEEGVESRKAVRIARAVRIVSRELGLIGVADVVEFHRIPGGAEMASPNEVVHLKGTSGWWRPFPVEYKRGKPKGNDCDEVQVCAQAMCLEEMLDVSIPSGALYYGKPRRRTDVRFTEALRRRTRGLAEHLHVLVHSGQTPPPQYTPKCDSCSLLEICRPKQVAAKRGAKGYLNRVIQSNLKEDIGKGGLDPL